MAQVQEVARRLAPGGAPSGFDLEFTLDVPAAFWELEDMAATLVTGATADDVVLIDASFPTREAPRSYQLLDALMSRLLAQVPMLESSCRVVVSMHELPNLADQVHDLLSIGELDGRLAIVDDAGGHLGDSTLARRVLDLLRQNPPPDSAAEEGILRHRGIFRRADTSRVTNYLFFYDVLPEATARFQSRLVSALSSLAPDVVVFDSSISGSWFPSMVQAACVQLQTTHSATLTPVDLCQWVAYQDGALQEPQRSRVEDAAAVIARPDSLLTVVVPAYASGRSLSRALEIVGRHDLERCAAVAIFADTAADLRPSAVPGMKGLARQRYGGRTLEVQCMHQVELRTIERDDWLVQAAEALGEVRDLPVDSLDRGSLDTTALWSLYNDCGVGAERVPAGGRPAKRYFPDLSRLDDWDAHWLAEAAVANILKRLPTSNRSAMLVVLPAEDNGTRPISRALAAKCRTAVLPVPRSVIEGDEPMAADLMSKLKRHTADTIAVLDESTVTHRTLEKLVRLVENSIQVRPDLVGAVIDVSAEPPAFDIPFFALSRWTAFAEES